MPGIPSRDAGGVLQPVADSPHDPTSTPGRLDVTSEVVKALQDGRLRVLARKRYFQDGRYLVDIVCERVDP